MAKGIDRIEGTKSTKKGGKNETRTLTYFLIRPDGTEKEYCSLKDAKEAVT